MNLKIGYVIDSSSGLTKQQAEAKGWYFLPLVINVNGTDYMDGDNLQPDEYYKMLKITDEVRTSATPPGIVAKVLQKATQTNDFVIVYPISKYLSSQYNSICVIANEIKNVRVVASKGIGKMIENEVISIQEFAKQNHNIDQIMKFAHKNVNSWSGLLIPQTLDWLVKGGRINASIAAMASLLKIVPIIRFRKGKLEKEGKGTTFKKTCLKAFNKLMLEAVDKKVYVLIGKGKQEQVVTNEIKAIKSDVIFSHIPPIIANHCGPNAVIFIAKIK